MALYDLFAIVTHGKSSQNTTAAVGEHEAGADYRPDAQCVTKNGCRVLVPYAFIRNLYYMGQELYKTKFNFKCFKCVLCSQELSA